MKTKKEIDYKKPIYINSFNADEIIFNKLRGTHVKACKYDGSIPVSLDSLKILEMCSSSKKEYKKYKEMFPKAFYKVGSDEREKMFCDAIINVSFSSDHSFDDIDIIKEDHNTRIEDQKVKDSSVLKEVEESYREFLEKYQENKELWEEQEKLKEQENTPKSKAELSFGSTDFLMNGGRVALEAVNLSVDGTIIKANARIKNCDLKPSRATLMLFVCQEGKKGINDVVGIYEYDEFEIEKGKYRTAKANVDIKDIAGFDEEAKKFVVKKGRYELFIGNREKQVHVVSLIVGEDIESSVIYQPPGWIDEIDWPFYTIDSAKEQKAPQIEMDTRLQRTFNECGQLFSKILNDGVNKLIEENESIKKEWGITLQIRALLYSQGFDFEAKHDKKPRHYVAYKRSASKSKTGSCLFIWDEIYEELKKWTWMDEYFDENDKNIEYDLTSIKAYEALTLSNIEKSFKLDKKNMLIIDPKEGESVKGNRRLICSQDKDDVFKIHTLEECKRCDNENCRKAALESGNKIWDGQALLDESVFSEVFPDEQHGMMLLRNRFFKACAFNTRIKDYFEENGIETVYDMFGQRRKASEIKLIFTPDSLKYLKFYEELPVELGQKEQKEKDPDTIAIIKKKILFNRWLENLKSCDFGVVKTDKPNKKSGKHKVGYQVLNTLPLDKKEMEKLFEHQKEYILSLWEDDDLFRRIIPTESAKGRFISRMCELINDPNDPEAGITADFYQCDDYINYKRQLISDIKKRMRRGAIELEGEMLTLCSMPFEMLQYSGMKPKERKKNGIRSLLDVDEAFIDGFPVGKPVTLCRYPHLSAGSVCGLKNVNVPEYRNWFKLRNSDDSSSIIVISPYNSNIMVKLGGADFDSDTALFIKEDIVQKAAAKLREKEGLLSPLCDKYAPGDDGLPVAQAGEMIKGEAKKYTLDPYSLARLDQSIAGTQKNIGTFSNDIQLFNSYMWEGLRSGRESEYCQKIYECIMKLSVLNELEIDRSKHSVNIDTKSIHSDIMKTEYAGKPILESPDSKVKIKRVKDDKEETSAELVSHYNPAFLYEIKKDRGAKNVVLRPQKQKYWDCPPDHLSELAAKIRKPRTTYNKKSLAFNYEDVEGKMEGGQTGKIREQLILTVKELDKIDKRRHKTGEELEERMRIQSKFVEMITDMRSIRPKNIACIVREAMCMKDKEKGEYYNKYMYSNKYRVMGLLFMAEKEINRIEGKKDNPIRQVLQKIIVLDPLSEEK